MTHYLKIAPEWFETVKSGIKTFEVRKDDREPKYAVNDELILEEFDGEKYTGESLKVLVTLVLREKYCKEGYCIMSIKLLESEEY